MDPLLATFIILAAMAAVVLVFRAFIRRPSSVTQEDPPGVRTVVTFRGKDPAFFQDDKAGGPLVGTRLFHMLCDGLAGRGIHIEERGTLQNAHRAFGATDGGRFAIVLEWTEQRWIAGIDWVPASAAEQRHLRLTHQVFAPPDSPGLRRLLAALDGWLKSRPEIRDVSWHRKERWIAEDTSDGRDSPLESRP
jgi:hypothetical protein